MSGMASQITSLTIAYLTFYSGVDHRKHQSSASLAFVRGIHRWLPCTKGQWRGKSFHLMTSSWFVAWSAPYHSSTTPQGTFWAVDTKRNIELQWVSNDLYLHLPTEELMEFFIKDNHYIYRNIRGCILIWWKFKLIQATSEIGSLWHWKGLTHLGEKYPIFIWEKVPLMRLDLFNDMPFCIYHLS